MTLIDFQNRSEIYWAGLFILAISFAVLFSVVWYSVFPIYSFGGYGIIKNLTNSTPIIVGAMVFIAIGVHMILSGRRRNA
jgi:hypothetical protein